MTKIPAILITEREQALRNLAYINKRIKFYTNRWVEEQQRFIEVENIIEKIKEEEKCLKN